MTSLRITFAVGVSVLLACLCARVAQAQEAAEAPPPGWYEHEGLFARVTLGLASVAVQEDGRYRELDVGGVGGMLSFSAGWTVADRLALVGDLYGGEVYDPSVHVGGRSLGAVDAAFTVVGMGPGLVGYLPSNVHVMLSMGVGYAYLEYIGDQGYLETAETALGISLHAMLGYEWWITPEGGVGVAAEMLYLSAHDTHAAGAPALEVATVGVALTATHN